LLFSELNERLARRKKCSKYAAIPLTRQTLAVSTEFVMLGKPGDDLWALAEDQK